MEVVKAESPVTLEEELEDHGTDTSKPSGALSQGAAGGAKDTPTVPAATHRDV